MGETVGFGVGETVGLGVGVGETVGLGVDVGVGEEVGVGVGVGAGFGVYCPEAALDFNSPAPRATTETV